jgi:diguanylate cyclase (GGDEF)-like protein
MALQERQIALLKRENAELRALAHTDAVTGLANGHALDEVLPRLVAGVTRTNGAVSLMVIDVDGLRVVNEMLGHRAGDMALRRVVSSIARVACDAALTARIGGDELAVVLTDTDATRAFERAERMRATAGQLFACRPHRLTVSVGVATVQPAQLGIGVERVVDVLRSGADAALRLAKRMGGNCVYAHLGDQAPASDCETTPDTVRSPELFAGPS